MFSSIPALQRDRARAVTTFGATVRCRALLALGLVLVCSASVRAQPTERETLAVERGRVEAAFAAEEAVCANRFFVNACVEDVRVRRRAALAPLVERELLLDEAERRARADERLRAIRARQEAAASRPSPASAPQPGKAPGPVGPASAASPSATREPPDLAQREAEAARRAAAAQKRTERAREAQERIARREAERAASRKAAQPLPVPASAASP